MVDIVDHTTRSRMMASIKGKNTRPEMLVRRFLHVQGFRYRLHVSWLPGKPDIVLPKYKLVIFVHGCFWHRHIGCKLSTCPEQNKDKWKKKFQLNIDRDRRDLTYILAQGWRVAIIWECGLRTQSRDLSWLTDFIKNENQFVEWPIVIRS